MTAAKGVTDNIAQSERQKKEANYQLLPIFHNLRYSIETSSHTHVSIATRLSSKCFVRTGRGSIKGGMLAINYLVSWTSRVLIQKKQFAFS